MPSSNESVNTAMLAAKRTPVTIEGKPFDEYTFNSEALAKECATDVFKNNLVSERAPNVRSKGVGRWGFNIHDKDSENVLKFYEIPVKKASLSQPSTQSLEAKSSSNKSVNTAMLAAKRTPVTIEGKPFDEYIFNSEALAKECATDVFKNNLVSERAPNVRSKEVGRWSFNIHNKNSANVRNFYGIPVKADSSKPSNQSTEATKKAQPIAAADRFLGNSVSQASRTTVGTPEQSSSQPKVSQDDGPPGSPSFS